jgi:hypothetical protein
MEDGAMSDFNGLVAICFFGLGGFFVFYYASRVLNEFYFKAITGVVDGSPVSPASRLFLLHQLWLTSVGSVVFLGGFCTLAQLEFAAAVENSGVKLVAYGGAFIAAVGGIGWLVTGINAFFYGRSLVRQAEAD